MVCALNTSRLRRRSSRAPWQHHSFLPSRTDTQPLSANPEKHENVSGEPQTFPGRCYDYTAFGESYAANTSETINQRYTYTGREASSVGAPMYYRWRMYSTGIGRFTARDPIGYDGGIGLYAYVKNKPYFMKDAFGLKLTATDITVETQITQDPKTGFLELHINSALPWSDWKDLPSVNAHDSYLAGYINRWDSENKCCILGKLTRRVIVQRQKRSRSALHIIHRYKLERPLSEDEADAMMEALTYFPGLPGKVATAVEIANDHIAPRKPDKLVYVGKERYEDDDQWQQRRRYIVDPDWEKFEVVTTYKTTKEMCLTPANTHENPPPISKEQGEWEYTGWGYDRGVN